MVAPRWTFWAAAVGLGLAQLGLSFALRHHNFFNDDLEHLTWGRFFSSVYSRQYNVHMPLGALLSFLWGHVFGFSVLSNRMLAAALDIGVLVTMLYLGRRYLSLAAGLIAALCYLVLEPLLWAYLYLSEIPSVLFALLGLVHALRWRETPEARRGARMLRAFVAGLLFGLAAMARILIVEWVAAALMVLLVQAWRRREAPPGPWMVGVARDTVALAVGAALPFLGFLALFSALGTAKDFLYWSWLHNLETKSTVDPRAWVGFLHVLDIRAVWRFVFTALGLSFVGFTLHWYRHPDARAQSFLMVVWAAAFGGWLGANPSGIGALAFHAIPAFPPLALAVGAGAVGLTRWARRWRRASLLVPALVAVGLGLTLRRSAALGWVLVTQPFVDPLFAWTERVGGFIREHSAPDDTLFVFGSNPYLYVVAERDSATTFSILIVEQRRHEDAVLDQLQRSPPRYVLMNPADYWYSLDARYFPRVLKYLLEHYRVVEGMPELLEPTTPENAHRVYVDPTPMSGEETR